MFKGQVCIRSSSNIYNTSLMAALVSHLGAKATQKWAQAVVANFARKPQGNDISHIRAVAIGECRIAVIITFYLARLAYSQNPDEAALADQVGLIFPNQDSFGTHVNISGGGILKHAPNRENAVKFLKYLTSSSAQAYFANGNNEYPIIPDVAPTAAIAKLGTFKEDTLSAEALGSNQAEAIRIMGEALAKHPLVVEYKKVERWGGTFPSTFMGGDAGAQTLWSLPGTGKPKQ